MAPDRIAQLLQPLEMMSGSSEHLQARPLAVDAAGGERCILPRYVFAGSHGGGDPLRIGIFAAIHGDEPAGAHAAVRFLQRLQQSPELARGYAVFVYPVCNPTGFQAQSRCSATGFDLNRQFWCSSTEPEVVLLEKEIRDQRFHGLISLHADDTSEGLYGFVRGAVLTRHLLEPALSAAAKFLPRNTNAIIDGFAAENGIISHCYDGILTSPPEFDLEPFEIILETPHLAPQHLQEEAFLAAMGVILAEYQKFLSFAADL